MALRLASYTTLPVILRCGLAHSKLHDNDMMTKGRYDTKRRRLRKVCPLSSAVNISPPGPGRDMWAPQQANNLAPSEGYTETEILELPRPKPRLPNHFEGAHPHCG